MYGTLRYSTGTVPYDIPYVRAPKLSLLFSGKKIHENNSITLGVHQGLTARKESLL